ncbi:M48 family metallopeptidase [Geomonas sp. Red32]|uniref:M48 family metallopeptidase n=1 Tax=Geomonas sp. Red32 TaxID=2912856 RepID=UPI00202CB61B|nr:M48 family metallopeptidase [Geomonas sp. Red32]MCM0083443.1 M48 family metallopeptidase [Geomonas sp. Red32]
MSEYAATWYDGQTSRGHDVIIHLDGEMLRVAGEGVACEYPLSRVRMDQRLGKARRCLRFEDGAVAEGAADVFLDELLSRQGKNGVMNRVVPRWEMNLKKAFAALGITVIVVACFMRFGVPILAEKLAFALPPATEEVLGRHTLELLDEIALKPSELGKERQEDLTRRFAAIVAGHPDRQGWRLVFRSSKPIGANAFALPSGIVVITDRMVEIAENDDQITGVLAHEVGHLVRRHSLRNLLQNSVTALLIATLTGDITSLHSIAATLPTALIDAKYSRDFEREADDAAVAYLKEKRIPIRSYAEILALLAKDHNMAGEGPRFGELFDNHPMMLERVQRVLAGSGG